MIIFCRGAPQGGLSCPFGAIHLLYLTENTTQAASVRLVRCKRTRRARSRLQSFCQKRALPFFDSLKYIQYSLFLRFPNFELGQKSCLRLLAELRGAALYFSAAFTKDFSQNAFYPRRGVSVGGEKLYRTIRQKSSFSLCSMPQRGICDTQKGRRSIKLPRPISRKQSRLHRVRERRRSNLLSRSPGLRFPGHVPAFSEDSPNDRLSSHT